MNTAIIVDQMLQMLLESVIQADPKRDTEYRGTQGAKDKVKNKQQPLNASIGTTSDHFWSLTILHKCNINRWWFNLLFATQRTENHKCEKYDNF